MTCKNGNVNKLLHCIVFCIALHCIALPCIVLYCIVSYCILLNWNVNKAITQSLREIAITDLTGPSK